MPDPLEERIRRAAPEGPSPRMLDRIERSARPAHRHWHLAASGAAAAALIALVAQVVMTPSTPPGDGPPLAGTNVLRLPADSRFFSPVSTTEPFITRPVYHVTNPETRP